MSRVRRFAMALLMGALLLAPLPAAAQGGGPVYIVQQGDTLGGIARMFGTTLEALVSANGISDPSKIFPGVELIIPGFEGVQGVLTLRPIAFGETLESLSLRYAVDAHELARLNRLVNPAGAYAGQLLILPVREQVEVDQGVTVFQTQKGEGRLMAAAQHGVNPWDVKHVWAEKPRLWTLPGEVWTAAGGDAPPTGLPSPIGDIAITPSPVVQGHTTEITVASEDPIWIEGELGGRSLAFFQSGAQGMVALQGIHALADPGLQMLTLRFFFTPGDQPALSFQMPVRVIEGGYGFQYLNGVPPETVDPSVVEPEEALIRSLLAEATPDRLWDGPFDYPSTYYTASFISVFGTRRSYNGGALNYYHTGLDFYGRDNPIYAPARGRVVFAGPLTIRGNATYIDHGWGVYSGYLHQSEIYVKEGDLVERGQLIGKVGGTGRVTGPHLHWEIWVGGVPVDPLDWVENSYP